MNGDGNFNDASGSTTDMIDFSSYATGDYHALVRVEDGDGGVDTRSFNISIVPEPTAGCLATLALGMLATRRKRTGLRIASDAQIVV